MLHLSSLLSISCLSTRISYKCHDSFSCTRSPPCLVSHHPLRALTALHLQKVHCDDDWLLFCLSGAALLRECSLINWHHLTIAVLYMFEDQTHRQCMRRAYDQYAHIGTDKEQHSESAAVEEKGTDAKMDDGCDNIAPPVLRLGRYSRNCTCLWPRL